MKLNKQDIILIGMFLVGGLFLLLSPLLLIFNLISLFLLSFAFLYLGYRQVVKYKRIKQNVSEEKEELILEMATEENGEEYVYNKNKTLKQKNKNIKEQLQDYVMKIGVCFLIGGTLLYFAIKMITLL